MHQTLIHYGPFKRSPTLDQMINDQVKSISEHFSASGAQTFQIWIDRIRARRSRNNVSYRCKMKVLDEHGHEIFVDKRDQNLFGALNRARRATLNVLDHAIDKNKAKRGRERIGRVIESDKASDKFLSE